MLLTHMRLGREKITLSTRTRRKFRAISPVLATLMMIAIAVAASLVAYAWVMGYLDLTTNKVGKAIQIQSSAIDGVSNNLLVYVQNVGTSPVKFDPAACVYVSDQLKICQISGDNPLGEGKTATLEIGADDAQNFPMKIKVVTLEGTTTESMVWKLESGTSPTETAIFYSGFENGDISDWDTSRTAAGGTINIQSDIKKTGTYASKTTLASDWSYGVLVKTIPTQTAVYCRAYVQFSALPSTGQRILVGAGIMNSAEWDYSMPYVFNDAGTLKWSLYSESYSDGDHFADSPGATINANQWYCIEVYFKVDASQGEAKMWVDGTQVASMTGLNTAGIQINKIQSGGYIPGTALAVDVLVDEVVVANSYMGQ